MTSPGQNVVEIRVVARDMTGPGFDAATRRAKGLASATSGGPASVASSMKEAERQAAGLGGTLRRVGEVAGGVLVAGVVQQAAQRAVQLVHSTAEAASGLSESVNAVNQTFAASAEQITEWGESNANAIGLSQRAFNQSATVLGAMLKNQGLSMDQVTDETTRLTERAADMASVFNTDVNDALAAIQAGLRGEIDPLERYGVSLSAAAVEQRALADTGKTATRELTATDKALARLAVLYEQTDQVAGDFRNTSDGMANSQRIATAQIEDAQAKIGTAFMPVLAKASQLTGDFAQRFADMPGPIQIAAVAVLGLGGAIGFLAPKALAAKAALASMATSGSVVQRSMAKATVVVGKVSAGLAAMQIAGSLVSDMLQGDLNPQVEAVVKGLSQWDGKAALAGESARLFGEDAEDLTDSMWQLASSGFGQGVNEVDNWAAHLMGTTGFVDEAKETIAAFDGALAEMVRNGDGEQAFLVVQAAAGKANVSVEEARSILPAYSAALEVAAKSTSEVAQAADEAAKSIDELDKEYDKIIESAFGFEEAQDAAADAIADLNEQLERQREQGEEGAGALTGNTQAARDNREAVRDLVELYKDLIIQAAESGHSTDGLSQELEDQLVSMGFARGEVQHYIETLMELQHELDKIKSKEVTLRFNVERNRHWGAGILEFAHGGVTGAAAGGGPRGSRTLVGERGPEIVDLPFGSTVHSNADSTRIAAQASNAAVPAAIEVRFGGDLDSAFATWFMRLLRDGLITIRPQALES